jgi:hypothetical protein
MTTGALALVALLALTAIAMGVQGQRMYGW